MTYQLPRLAPRLREPEAEDNVVETAFQLLQEQFAGYTLRARGFLKVVAELALEGEIDALGFLFFSQLETVANDLGFTILPMLSGSKVALLDRTLIAEAFRAFEEQLHALAAA
jgi:hypothetical protein